MIQFGSPANHERTLSLLFGDSAGQANVLVAYMSLVWQVHFFTHEWFQHVLCADATLRAALEIGVAIVAPQRGQPNPEFPHCTL